jgi:putative heme-binding domain-containing protein
VKSDDPFLRQSAVLGLIRSKELGGVEWKSLADPSQRLALLQAVRWQHEAAPGKAPPEPPAELLERALADPNPLVRLYAIRWVADWGLTRFAAQVEKQAALPNTTPELFLASAATLELFKTGSAAKFDPKDLAAPLLQAVRNDRLPAPLRATVLRLLPPEHPQLTLEILKPMLTGTDRDVQREAVRTLALSPRADRFALLAKLAEDLDLPESSRADAVMGLTAKAEEHRPLLQKLAGGNLGAVSREAQRALRPADGEKKPAATDIDAWLKLTEQRGDAEAGWRVFFGAQGGRCAACHRFDGRGASVGPDLTLIGKQTTRRRLLESLLQPSREMAPWYVPWVLETTDGRTLQGLSLGQNEKGTLERFIGPKGTLERFMGPDGKAFEVAPSRIDSRTLAKQSIMPDGLEKSLSVEDLRNLLELLTAGPSAAEERK